VITPQVANGVIIVVTVVWAVSFVVPIVSPGYRADPQVNAIFMGLVGGALALKSRSQEGDDPS
jgi:hypothetical protein